LGVIITFAGMVTTFAASIHQHVNAGAHGSAPGAPLYFVNGDRFEAASGFVVPLEPADTGPQAGLFHGSITFTALAATPDLGGPAFDHAALGAHLELVVESVEGPVGGRFGFWEGAGEGEGTELTFEVPVGVTNGVEHLRLSENSGEPGEDPYGHVHGRVFSATLPGLYVVGLRILDTSTLGADGGPIHPPSALFRMNFQAGLTLDHIARDEAGWSVEFAASTGFTYVVEKTDVLGPTAVWNAVGDPVQGDDHLHTVTLPGESTSGFLRLRRNAP
jgi:hypothetical protein